MAVLASIRNRPIYLIMIIGMALFAFVISGVFKGDGAQGGGSLGSVNGEEINSEKFSRLLEAQKNNKVSSIQAVKNVWNSVVKEEVYKDAIVKAGIIVGEKDIWDNIVSNPAIQNSPNFKDESGLFDENKLKEHIATLKDNKDTKEGAAIWQDWISYESSIKSQLEQTSYDNLVKSGLFASLKEGERVYKSENTSSDIEMVFEPYSTIKDDEVTVSDSEITSYMNSHSKEFTQEAYTEVDYVKFEVKPSDADIKDVKTKISKIVDDYTVWNSNTKQDEVITGFKNTKDALGFVRANSDISHVDKLYTDKDLPASMFDSLKTKEVGFVYGPYRDGDYFKIAKILSKDGEKSVKSSHILIAYEGAERVNPEVKRTREEAEEFANNLFKEINKDNFAEKAKENSDGPSASKGGELGFYKQGQLAKEYNDYIFNEDTKIDQIKVVETSFGFHIIKLDEKKNDPGLKLAIVSHKIDPSEETENLIYQQAETLALDITNGKDIKDLAKENDYKIGSASNITALTENISSLGKQREIVKWSFNEANKQGDVKRFDLDNGDYAIVVLKNRFKKGLKSLDDVKKIIKPILVKSKKTELIKSKISGSTLEEMAKSINKSVITSKGVSIANASFKAGGKDVGVAGALLYINENDIKVIEGNNGIFVIKVVKKNPAYEIKNFNTYSNNITNKLKNRGSKIYDALKEQCEIEDNRALFY